MGRPSTKIIVAIRIRKQEGQNQEAQRETSIGEQRGFQLCQLRHNYKTSRTNFAWPPKIHLRHKIAMSFKLSEFSLVQVDWHIRYRNPIFYVVRLPSRNLILCANFDDFRLKYVHHPDLMLWSPTGGRRTLFPFVASFTVIDWDFMLLCFALQNEQNQHPILDLSIADNEDRLRRELTNTIFTN